MSSFRFLHRQMRANSHKIEKQEYLQNLSNRTPWEREGTASERSLHESLLAPLNDQYTDRGIWSIDDKEWAP